MNQIDLPAMLRAKGRLGRPLVIRPVEVPVSVEKGLLSLLRPFLRAWAEEIREGILPAYEQTLSMMTTDAMSPSIRNALEAANRRGETLVLRQTELLGKWVVGTEQTVRARLGANVRSATGVDVAPYMLLGDVRDTLDAAIEENVSLIGGLNARQRQRVERIVWRGLIDRMPKREVVRELAKAMRITQNEARRIARDQTGKLSGKLVELRQRQLGIRLYRWETRGDDRVRPTHRRKNGRIYNWDRPPADTGHPGHDINCRCIAAAVVS